MSRRCSHCSNNGHNSRTCPSRGGCVKLFGVKLTDGSIIKKSASMGNLNLSSSAHYRSSSPNPGSPSSDLPDGYLSDDPAHAAASSSSSSSSRRFDRRKGVPWSLEEHRLFLLGLRKLGKGDWRGISRNFVTSRTPTQVASHAQKYFIRQSNPTRRKRRSSLFDMVTETGTDTPPLLEEWFMFPPQAVDTEISAKMPSLSLSLEPECQPMETSSLEQIEEAKETVMQSDETLSILPAYFPALLPIPFPLWPPNAPTHEEEKGAEASHHWVLKPIPIIPKEPVNVDELVGLSRLSLGEHEAGGDEPSPLSLKLLGEPSRQSAFHASTPVNGSENISKGKNGAIRAV